VNEKTRGDANGLFMLAFALILVALGFVILLDHEGGSLYLLGAGVLFLLAGGSASLGVDFVLGSVNFKKRTRDTVRGVGFSVLLFAFGWQLVLVSQDAPSAKYLAMFLFFSAAVNGVSVISRAWAPE